MGYLSDALWDYEMDQLRLNYCALWIIILVNQVQVSYYDHQHSGTKPNLVAKFWLPTLVSSL